MALAPISVRVPALDGSQAPRRPAAPGERIAVPGNPQAEPRRSPDAPGRVPVAIPGDAGDGPADAIERIDKQVRESREYQAIKPFLAERQRRDDEARESERDREHHLDERDAAEPLRAEIPDQPTTPPPAGRTPPARDGNGRPVQQSDPLVLDLDGDGLETTGVASGVRFDIDADGDLDQTSFVTGGDAFLAIDANGNGRIDDGRELFGDQTGHASGFAALAAHDGNGDGLIDAGDAVFERLRLFTQSTDGSQQLRSLESAGISAIRLDYRTSELALNSYDRVAQLGSFVREDGSEGLAGDLLLGHSDLPA